MTDHAVNEWTRDDLPGIYSPGIYGHEERQGADAALDAVVDHLNANHPKSVAQMPKPVHVPEGPRTTAMALMMAGSALDRIERIERERDATVARADQLRDERDNAVQSCITVGRARDEWRARAEAAEARTGIDRIRAILDKCADDTRPGECDYADIYNAYESAIDAISRIAYPEEAA